MKDERDCPECGTRMNEKYTVAGTPDFESKLYQCPKCKNIEVL